MFRRNLRHLLQVATLAGLAAWTVGWGSRATAEISCQQPNGWHIAYRNFVCPLGGEKFKALAMGTHGTYGAQFDLKPIGSANYPRPLPVCPTNGFVMYQKDYSADELAAVEAIVSEPEYQEIYNRNTGYFLLAHIWERLGKTDYDPWWLYLQASWEADDCDAALHQEYMIKTRDLALDRLENKKLEEDERLTMEILIANIDRRLGNFDAAKERLELAFDFRDPDLTEIAEEYRLELLQFIDEENRDRQVMRSIHKKRRKKNEKPAAGESK